MLLRVDQVGGVQRGELLVHGLEDRVESLVLLFLHLVFEPLHDLSPVHVLLEAVELTKGIPQPTTWSLSKEVKVVLPQ